MYFAQLDENNVCFSISEYDTGIPAVTDNLGQVYNYETGEWEETSLTINSEPHQPTNAEIAQQISDLEANLIIAGVL